MLSVYTFYTILKILVSFVIQRKLTISVGRGLPKFTSADYSDIANDAIDYLNFNNFDKGVRKLVEETNKRLRELYDESK